MIILSQSINPLVSVIIPTYRRCNMLSRAIDSVLLQTYKNIEIIVVDDNDPQTEWRMNTSLLMKKYLVDSRIRYVCHPHNMNGSVARNTGIHKAKGEIITFLDDDDYYYREKIELQVKFLIEHKEYKAVYCGWYRKRKIVPSHAGDMTYDLLSSDHIIITNTIMMWKEYAIKCGGFDSAFLRHQEAIFLVRYFALGEKIGVIRRVLVKFDMTDRSNEYPDSKKGEAAVRQLLDYFWYEIECCEKRKRGSKNNILSHRYRGVILNHLKNRDFANAKRVYIEMIKRMPIKFNIDFILYAIKWVLRLNKES